MSNLFHTLVWLMFALAFWMANVILHLDFSNWLTTRVETSAGIIIPLNYKFQAAVAVSIILSLILCRQFRNGENHKLTMLYWTIWLLSSYLITRYLITTNLELIHFLQYGVLSYLFALVIDQNRTRWPLATLILVTLAFGIIDELNQYFFLTPANSAHMDFNDFFLNLQGAAGGLLFFYGFRFQGGDQVRRTTYWILSVISLYLACALGIVILIANGTLIYMPDHSVPPGGIETVGGLLKVYLQREPNLLGSWNTSFSGGQYYVLGAIEGISLLVMATAIYSSYGYFSLTLRPKPETSGK